MAVVYIGIGSNIGNREQYIEEALAFIESAPDIVLEKVSSLIETDSVPDKSFPKFLNAAAKINTEMPPRAFLLFLQSVETKIGRVRVEKNAPRTIDLDILLYGDREINDGNLVVPHPRMFERYFVLAPLLEIAPDILNNPLMLPHKDKIMDILKIKGK